MRRVCSEAAYRARLSLGGHCFLALALLCPASETQLLEYRIIVQSELSQKTNRVARLIQGVCLRLFGLALELSFQLLDLFDRRFLHIPLPFTTRTHAPGSSPGGRDYGHTVLFIDSLCRPEVLRMPQ